MSHVLRRISTGEILRRAVPDDQVALVVGLDPDLEYLREVVLPRPAFDPRYFVLTQDEGKVGVEWRTTYGTQKRPAAEIAAAVDNTERERTLDHVPQEDLVKLAVLGLAVIFRANSGLQLTPKERAIRDRLMGIGTKLWKNSDRAEALKAAVLAGQEPDLDTGWEAPG